jgi:hypothetical protein
MRCGGPLKQVGRGFNPGNQITNPERGIYLLQYALNEARHHHLYW